MIFGKLGSGRQNERIYIAQETQANLNGSAAPVKGRWPRSGRRGYDVRTVATPQSPAATAFLNSQWSRERFALALAKLISAVAPRADLW